MIYVNGCSFTYGDELTDRSVAWPNLLGKKLRSAVSNQAFSGRSNYGILYQTIKNLKQNYNFYIIAWTTTTRYTFYAADNNFEINFNPKLINDLYKNQYFYKDWGKILYTHWHNELYALKLWLQQIVQLQTLFEKFNKKYLMINTMSNNLEHWLAPKDQFIESCKHLINFDLMNDEQIFAEYEEINYYVDCIDKQSYYKWNQFTIDSLTKLYPIGSGGHFLDSGHAHMANLIYDHLNV